MLALLVFAPNTDSALIVAPLPLTLCISCRYLNACKYRITANVARVLTVLLAIVLVHRVIYVWVSHFPNMKLAAFLWALTPVSFIICCTVDSKLSWSAFHPLPGSAADTGWLHTHQVAFHLSQSIHSNKWCRKRTRLSKVRCKSILKYGILNQSELIRRWVQKIALVLFHASQAHLSKSSLSIWPVSLTPRSSVLALSSSFVSAFVADCGAVGHSWRILHFWDLGLTTRCHLSSVRWLQLPRMIFANGSRRTADHWTDSGAPLLIQSEFPRGRGWASQTSFLQTVQWDSALAVFLQFRCHCCSFYWIAEGCSGPLNQQTVHVFCQWLVWANSLSCPSAGAFAHARRYVYQGSIFMPVHSPRTSSVFLPILFAKASVQSGWKACLV